MYLFFIPPLKSAARKKNLLLALEMFWGDLNADDQKILLSTRENGR